MKKKFKNERPKLKSGEEHSREKEIKTENKQKRQKGKILKNYSQYDENRRERRQNGVVEEVEERLTWERLEEAGLKEERYKKTLRVSKKGSYNVILQAKQFHQSFGIHRVMIVRLLKVLKHFQ